ncbi:hypothetical protein Tco_0088435 [Tanacetum coccineum]
MGEGSANPTDPHHTPTFIQPSPQPRKTQKPRKPKRKNTQVPQPSDPTESITDEDKELGDSLIRAATTASSLEAEQDSGGSPSDEDRHKLDELMALCTTLQNRVLDLEKIKTTQDIEISSLKRRVKKLEKKNRSRTHKLKRLHKIGLRARVESSDEEESLGEDASKQGRIDAIDADEEITLVSVAGDKVSAATTISTATTIDDITLAQALKEMKSTKPKTKRVVIQELGESTTTKSSQLSSQQSQDKEQEANIALIETLDDIQANIDVEHQLAKRLQAQEQKELSIEEKATLFQQLLKKIIKHFADKRAEEIRNKPPTKAQQRKIMCTYLKNMEGYKLKDLKSKGFDSIQEMFDRAFKRVNTFEDFRTELVESKEKRAGAELNMRNLNLDLLCDPSSDGCRKIDAKFGNADRGFVSLVVGGGVGVDCGGGGVKDGNDCMMTVVYTGEDLVITKIGIYEKFKNLDAKSDEWEGLVTGTSIFFAIV